MIELSLASILAIDLVYTVYAQGRGFKRFVPVLCRRNPSLSY